MLLFVLTWLALLSIPSLGADEEAHNKLIDLIQRSAQTPKISFSEQDFERFIVKGPRPYWIFAILTAIKSNNCNPCRDLNPEFETLANKIEEQRKATIQIDEPSNVFVVEVDFLDNREIFKKIGISTAPMLVMIPPTKSRREIPLSKFFSTIGPKYQYSLTHGRHAEDIGNWIAQVSKLGLSFGRKFELPQAQYIPLALMTVVASVLFFNRLRKWMLGYAMVSSLVYGFVLGGGMFSIIREVPFKGEGTSINAYISGGGRYQYALEGYILGALNLIAGAGAFLCYNSLRKSNEHSNRWFRWLAYIPAWVGLSIMAVGCYAIIWVYSKKNGGYNMGHVGMGG